MRNVFLKSSESQFHTPSTHGFTGERGPIQTLSWGLGPTYSALRLDVNLAVTSVTPLTASVDFAVLTG